MFKSAQFKRIVIIVNLNVAQTTANETINRLKDHLKNDDNPENLHKMISNFAEEKGVSSSEIKNEIDYIVYDLYDKELREKSQEKEEPEQPGPEILLVKEESEQPGQTEEPEILLVKEEPEENVKSVQESEPEIIMIPVTGNKQRKKRKKDRMRVHNRRKKNRRSVHNKKNKMKKKPENDDDNDDDVLKGIGLSEGLNTPIGEPRIVISNNKESEVVIKNHENGSLSTVFGMLFTFISLYMLLKGRPVESKCDDIVCSYSFAYSQNSTFPGSFSMKQNSSLFFYLPILTPSPAPPQSIDPSPKIQPVPMPEPESSEFIRKPKQSIYRSILNFLNYRYVLLQTSIS